LHCTAAGKVHLAFEPAEELQRCLSEELTSYTAHTIIDRNMLSEQINGIATAGYAIDKGEYLNDVHSVAVPIKDYTRTVVGSLVVIGPAYRISPDRIQNELIPLITKAGRELSSRLGYNG
jgi:DNA-binding IclR family transcriptional regulator